ncbi:DNA-directed DNA polymerase alpha subunit POL12 SCDLUD_000769 [Saccharomycodes ludwigii]|uniref:DNA-directed DNA polymerase alpha subunit POL12 n=1 Tax=Saccharomycodes ludwigii TaxID=36035 RepID=UPI001E820D56|nr:hypothetical protein SCDLUD_000769 [Saccharomycodes ludwigii]KAH3903155.1 hypothetical protein SCDLUD_000769 [Saccharomycodes ludwigii]
MTFNQNSELIKLFGPDLALNEDKLVPILENIMKVYVLDVDSLFIKWEQFSYHNKEATLSVADLNKFKDYIQKQMEKKINKNNNNNNNNNNDNAITSTSILASNADNRNYNVSNGSINTGSNSMASLKSKRKIMKHNTIVTSSPSTSFNNNHNSTNMSEKFIPLFDNAAKKRKINSSPIYDKASSNDNREAKSFLFEKDNAYNDHNKEISLNVSTIMDKSDDADTSTDFKTPYDQSRPADIIDSSKRVNQNISGKIMKSLNAHLDIAPGLTFGNDEGNVGEGVATSPKVSITPLFDAEKYRFRTMRQNVLDVAEYLDDQLETFEKIFYDAYNIELGDPTIQSQNEIYCCGRIVPDIINLSTENMLNSESLAIETSRSTGIGKRVKLKVDKIKNTSLFQGQIVGLRGKNADGLNFVVEEVLQIPLLPSPVTTNDELMQFNDKMKDSDMKCLITCGPYTRSDSLDYTLLSTFIDKVNNEYRPNVLIMLGPFIDISNELILRGKIPNLDYLGKHEQPRNLDELFIKVINPILEKINENIQLIIIPSINDTLLSHSTYPQPSFSKKILQMNTARSKNSLQSFPNPSTFQLNEIFVGCSNLDFFKNCKDVILGSDVFLTNRFERLTNHLLEQRRYFPLFPPTWNANTKRVAKNDKLRIFAPNLANEVECIYKAVDPPSIDVGYFGLTEFVGDTIPDLMILPSELNAFTSVVKNVVIVNPGCFISRLNGNVGTFAQLSVKKPDLDTFNNLEKVSNNAKEDDLYLHGLWKRARVDIIHV